MTTKSVAKASKVQTDKPAPVPTYSVLGVSSKVTPSQALAYNVRATDATLKVAVAVAFRVISGDDYRSLSDLFGASIGTVTAWNTTGSLVVRCGESASIDDARRAARVVNRAKSAKNLAAVLGVPMVKGPTGHQVPDLNVIPDMSAALLQAECQQAIDAQSPTVTVTPEPEARPTAAEKDDNGADVPTSATTLQRLNSVLSILMSIDAVTIGAELDAFGVLAAHVLRIAEASGTTVAEAAEALAA